MKKKCAQFITLTLVFGVLITSCAYEKEYEGIENFDILHSDTEINNYLLPSETFLDEILFKKAEYYYRDVCKSLFGLAHTEQAIIIIEYDMDAYYQAKEYCLETMDLEGDNCFEYSGYTFIENVALSKGKGQFSDGKNNVYPRWFNMLVYSDSKQCLIFMGFYASPEYVNEANLAVMDWGAFLERYYSDYYEFNT